MGLPVDLRTHLDNMLPQLNDDLCRGLARKHLEGARQHIDQAFRLVAARYPQGLEYLGLSVVPPDERCRILARRSGSQRTFDMARTDMEIVAAKHTFNGVALKDTYIAIPFVGPAARFHISDASLYAKPVLCDRVFSVTNGSVFSRLQKIKLVFQRRAHSFVTNEGTGVNRVPDQVIWSHIFNSRNSKARSSDTAPKTPLVLYLLAKYGATEAFRRFARADVVFGVSAERKEQLNRMYEGYSNLRVVDEDNFPPSEWVICSASDIRFRRKRNRDAVGIRIAVRKDQYTRLVRRFVVSTYYVLDHFPEHHVQYEFENPRSWQRFLGYILRGEEYSVGRMVEEMVTHMSSIETYLEAGLIADLESLGYKVRDFYEFIALVVEHYDKWVTDKDKKGNSPVGQEFTTLPYILYDVVAAINNSGFELAAPGLVVTPQNIVSIFGRNLRPTQIFNLVRGGHGEVDAADVPGDNYALTLTHGICPQADSSGSSRDHGSLSADRGSIVDGAWAMVYPILNASKAAPTGCNRVNQFLTLGAGDVVVLTEEQKQAADYANRYIFNK